MTLEDRIQHLERRCRRMSILLVTLVSAAALAVLTGAGANEDGIETSEVTIVDEQGNARIRLGYHENGYGIRILDADEELRAGIFDASAAAGVRLVKESGDMRLTAFQKGGVGLSLHDLGGRPRVVLGSNEIESSLELRDRKGEVQFRAPATD